MKNIEKISLDKRLENIKSDKANFLEVFEMFPEDYFSTWAEINEDVRFLERYVDEISCYSFSDGRQHYLNEVIQELESVSDEQRNDLLYKILVEPFVFKREEKS